MQRSRYVIGFLILAALTLGCLMLVGIAGAANDRGCFPVNSGSCSDLRLNTRTDPVTCGTSNAHNIYYDSGTKKLCVCDGTSYVCSAALATTTTTTTTSTSTTTTT